MVYEPGAANEVWNVAIPFALSGAIPRIFGPLKKVTCPVGVTVPCDWVTFAMNIMICPVPGAAFAVVNVVVVGNCKGRVISDSLSLVTTSGVVGSESFTVNTTIEFMAMVGLYSSTLPFTTCTPMFGFGSVAAVQV